MKRRTTGALTLGLALAACGGRYDDRAMERPGTGGSAGASNVGAGPSVAGLGGGAAGLGGSTSAAAGMPPMDELGPQCVASGEPPPLSGQLAEPAVVWNRISMLTWGKPMGPMPVALPATTTYDWAGKMVTLALRDVKNTAGGARGLESILRQWLDLTPEAPLHGSWADDLLNGEPALHVLLLTPFFEPERLGIFTEPSWLAEHSSISTRGAAIYRALLFPVPTPPAGVQPMLMPQPNLTDRQTLEAAIRDPACMGCHQIVDPPGFALGHFDAKGSYRTLDHGLPIDTTGSLILRDISLRTPFSDLQDFNRKLADSCAANTGFVGAFLQLALTINGVPLQMQSDFMDANAQRMRQAFLNGGRSYEALVKAYIQSPAGLYP
jgi:uncharacterized protein DUF1588